MGAFQCASYFLLLKTLRHVPVFSHTGRIMSLIRPLFGLLPEASSALDKARVDYLGRGFIPARIADSPELTNVQANIQERALYTAGVVVFYLFCAQFPLYGSAAKGPDPFAQFRTITASSRGTLMELGIVPLVTANLVLQLFVG
jgi:hypothetical protein